MTRHLLLAGLIIIGYAATQAQPNLRQSTLPKPFLSFTMAVCDTANVVPGPAGVGQVWNFNTLIQRGKDTTVTTYTDKSSLSPQLQEKLPRAEVVVIDDTTTTAFRTVDGFWRWEGAATPSATMVAGSDPYDVRPSEVVFNDPKSDRYDGTLESTALPPGQYPRRGSHRFIYDGFGQLILPDFTYNNVARTSQLDTTSAEFSIGPQRVFLTIVSAVTMWQSINENVPLMLIETVSGQVTNVDGVPIGPSFKNKTVRYRGRNAVTSVEEEVEHALVVTPSPSTTDRVSIKGLNVDPSMITLVNAIGEVITCPIARSDEGLTIDVRSLAPGRYTVLILDGIGAASRLRTASIIRVR